MKVHIESTEDEPIVIIAIENTEDFYRFEEISYCVKKIADELSIEKQIADRLKGEHDGE
jgi:hypothetical protein